MREADAPRTDAPPPLGLGRRRQRVDAADKVGDERRGRHVIDLFGRIHLLKASFVQHRNAISHRKRFVVFEDATARAGGQLVARLIAGNASVFRF